MTDGPRTDGPMTEGEHELYRQWYVGLCAAHVAHQRAAIQCQRRNTRLGIPVIVLSTAVGTAAFSSLQADGNPLWAQLALGLVSMTAAVLASLQTFLNFGELSEKHKAAAGRFGSLRRRFEHLIAREAPDLAEAMASIREEWDELDANTPSVSDALYRAAVEPARNRARTLFKVE